MRNPAIIVTVLMLSLVAFLGAYLFGVLHLSLADLKIICSSAENLREFILSFGLWAPLAFFVAQIVQVIITPIPANIIGLAGGALFGWLSGFLLNWAGLIVGSVIAFYLARYLGQSIVIRLIGRKVYRKYSKIFRGKYLFGLFLIFLFPFFPDDALCFLAGLSSLPFPLFLILVIVGRMPGTLFATLVGAGVIFLSLLQWIIVGLISFAVLYLLFRFQKPIKRWLQLRLGINLLEGD